MALKTLLVAFSTTREIDGEEKRVRFKAKSVVELTEAEVEQLEALTKATGKLHFRDPIKEGGKAVADEPEIVDVPDFAGQDVALDKKSVDQLKAYLDFYSVDYTGKTSKADLLAAAKAHEAGQTDNKAGGDPDSGL